MRVDAIAKAGLLLVLFRLAGLSVRYLVQPAGSGLIRLALFLPAAAAHTAALLIVIALFVLLSAAAQPWPGVRRAIVIIACAVFAVLMIAGQADLTVSGITGAPVTPTVFRTFRGLHVIKSNEFLEPLRANWLGASAGLIAFACVLIGIARVVRRDARVDDRSRSSAFAAAGLMAAAGCALWWLAALPPWPLPPPPIEVAFARESLGLDQTKLAGSEAEAIAELRSMLGLARGAAWVSDEYPLVWRPAPDPRAARRRADPPDIVVVMVESLRAEEVGFVTGAGDSVTPNLDRLAARSVVFPAYISNGFPSAPSVLAFHCSAWPHRRKEIITDFATRAFDSMPGRLRTRGYETLYIGADPNFDHQDVWLPQWYGTVVDLVAEGTPGTDRNIVTRSIAEMRRHDDARAGTPLFTFVSTYSTHYPFSRPPDADPDMPVADRDLRSTYRRTLRYADREIGRLLDFAATRPRRTVIVVVGDHGFYVDLRRTSGLPENDTVWTAAFIAGPDDLIGPPRRLPMAASHVDMLPTLMAIVGDDGPTASLGADLLGPPRNGARTALAIRSGGLRFDRDGHSTMVDARTPNVSFDRVAFSAWLPPADAQPPLDDRPNAARFTSVVNDWSYLVERNRVWNASLLSRGRAVQHAPVDRLQPLRDHRPVVAGDER